MELSTERCYVCFKDVNFFASLAFRTFPNVSLDITHPFPIKNPHVFYIGPLKTSQTVAVVCTTVLEVILKNTKLLLRGLVDESTYSSRLLIRHGFVEIRHVQTWAYWQELSCCSYTHSDMGFLIACINIPPSAPAGAVLYTRSPRVMECLCITFSMQKHYFYIC